MYNAANAQQGAQNNDAQQSNGNAKNDDNVQDADFEEVK
jgi:hypothetical protein